MFVCLQMINIRFGIRFKLLKKKMHTKWKIIMEGKMNSLKNVREKQRNVENACVEIV